jgi:Short C-terminal domain
MPRRLRRAAMVGGAAYVGKKAGERSAEKHAAEQQAADQPVEAQQESSASQVSAEAKPDYMTELEQLAKLRDQGVITPEEFEAKKKAILEI